MKYYDISPTINSKLAVFPGDTPFGLERLMDMQKGDHLSLSRYQMTAHLGAHADAPSHYHVTGEPIAARNLSYYLGPCHVLDATDAPRKSRLHQEQLTECSFQFPRVLFKTHSFPDPYDWNNDFVALAPELINFLARKKVRLVGLDTPSVDLADSQDLPAHQAIHQANMAILEGLELSEVPAGDYTLIALPLKIEAGEASPVRAILLQQPLPEWELT